jgi:hypothetical protein
MNEEAEKSAAAKSAEDEEKTMMSMRLAYQDLSVEKKKQVNLCFSSHPGFVLNPNNRHDNRYLREK